MHLTRTQLRSIAAAASLAMAAIYYLIGLNVLKIGGSSSGETVDLWVFGAMAGTAFLALAALLRFTDRRLVWIAALIFQVLVYVMYVAVSSSREPPFEVWGITLRVLQVPVLLAVAYLAFTRRTPEGAEPGAPIRLRR